VRSRLEANFTAWTVAIERCLIDAGARLPKDLDRRALAAFVLTTMEGGVMLARTYRDVAMFDGAVSQLRDYFARLLTEAGAVTPRRKSHRR
jgi:TetR/AcrR family transcriptional repressor of nem operon